MLEGYFLYFEKLGNFFTNYYFLGLLLASYLLGSIPFGLLIGKIFYATDVRKTGSKNIGATNVARSLGVVPGFATLMLDAAKSFLAAYLGWYMFDGLLDIALLAGVTCIIGHTNSIFLKFKGGKGIASLGSLLLAIDLRIFTVSAAGWVLVFLITRTSGTAAIVALILCPLSFFYFLGNSKILWLMSLLCLYLLVRHADNIKKLFKS